MSDIQNFGWGCYWKLRVTNTQITELIQIIKSLEGGEDKLAAWLEDQRIKEEEREEKRMKRELKKIGVIKKG